MKYPLLSHHKRKHEKNVERVPAPKEVW